MGLLKRKTPEERQAAAQKWLRRIDPGRANGHASVWDSYGGATGRLRKAQREYDLIREQRETNRLLREQAQDRQAM